MNTPRPCVMLWLAHDGTSDSQNSAYMRLYDLVKRPEGRFMVISGDDELVEIDDTILNLPLGDRYSDEAIAAAKQKGFERCCYVLAMYFRRIEEAPNSGPDSDPLFFIGRFEFIFPERGDHISRDEHKWLGIDSAYCLDEDPIEDELVDSAQMPADSFFGRLKRFLKTKE